MTYNRLSRDRVGEKLASANELAVALNFVVLLTIDFSFPFSLSCSSCGCACLRVQLTGRLFFFSLSYSSLAPTEFDGT